MKIISFGVKILLSNKKDKLMPYIIIISAILLASGISLVLYLLTKANFSKGKRVYDINIALKDRPDLLKRIKDCEDDMKNVPYEEMNTLSHDGLKLYGKLYRCEKTSDRYIICFHGYRSSPNDFICAMKLFLSLDYNILLVDQRCHGKSEGKWITFGIKERYDCISWCKTLINTFGNDIKIVLDGLSMGATTVLMAASLPELPQNVKAINADCGFSSPWDIVCEVARRDMHIPKFPLMYFMIPAVKIFAGFSLKGASTIESVKNTNLPILYIHGLDDDFVPHSMSLEAYNARPENSTIVSVKGAKHGLSYIIDEDACRDALIKHLGSI